jgi:SAM-dependent methyltransferase
MTEAKIVSPALNGDARGLPRCPVCGSQRGAERFQARDHHYGNPGTWWERRCADCGSFSLDPMPPEGELLGMYPQETYYSFRVSPRRPVRDALKRLLGVSFETREPRFETSGRILDFGCGAGEFLLKMRHAGWECAGVEVSNVAIGVARQHGFVVERSLSAFPSESFDYLRANHSLEHVVNPAAVLREMHRVLRPGGTLFIGVPTNSGLNAKLFGPYWWHLGAPVHPVTFSTPGLIALVMRTGFEVRRVSMNSDPGSLGGSLQIFLNRKSSKKAVEGAVFRFKPLLLLGFWAAKIQDMLRAGDRLELVAVKPRNGDPAPLGRH